MAKTKEKMWCVFGTEMGYFVSLKKMTIDEIKAVFDQGHLELKVPELGIAHYSNFFTSYKATPSWTRKEAERYADEQTLRARHLFNSQYLYQDDLFVPGNAISEEDT